MQLKASTEMTLHETIIAEFYYSKNLSAFHDEWNFENVETCPSKMRWKFLFRGETY